jgi:hypothetical protein
MDEDRFGGFSSAGAEYIDNHIKKVGITSKSKLPPR